jgi:hypothetical protein
MKDKIHLGQEVYIAPAAMGGTAPAPYKSYVKRKGSKYFYVTDNRNGEIRFSYDSRKEAIDGNYPDTFYFSEQEYLDEKETLQLTTKIRLIICRTYGPLNIPLHSLRQIAQLLNREQEQERSVATKLNSSNADDKQNR